MPDIEGLISDLAFILLLGAGVTLLFKWIKQPVVLGYIVAGFLASPHFTALPSVTTEANIEFWAQIGIVVLLFSLGLEFSFKKLVNTGGSAVVTALIIVLGMMATGFAIGKLLGFTMINSLFLGGMLSMSSTTIIIKAFTDMNLRQKKFASMVFAVLIVEDLFAVVMMVVLSSIAINKTVEGSEMLLSISKLVFFLVIWFLVGVYILPTLLNRTRRFLNNETLLVVSMGLCLSMAVFSVMCGFSMALGAFVMGSILAGTSYAERIEHVTMPVKDLFGGDDGAAGGDSAVLAPDSHPVGGRDCRHDCVRHLRYANHRAKPESGDTVGILADTDRRIRFHHRLARHVAGRAQS